MTTGRFTRLWLGCALLTAAASGAQAQQSFSVAGPVTAYYDGTTVDFSNYTFTARISYLPDTPPDGAPVVLFQGAVQQIEYAIFDGDGLEVHRMVAEGAAPGTQTSFIQVRPGEAGLSPDQLYYEATSLVTSDTSILAGRAGIDFSAPPGALFTALDQVPAPPAQGSYDRAAVEFVSLAAELPGTALTAAVFASGTVTLVDAGAADPYQECAEQAANHGQYVSCVAHVSNLLRAAGDISGRDKGQRQREAARR